MNGPNELVNEWLEKAQNDELNANSILTHKDGTPDAVCFLSQQMAEKLLKSLLVFYQIRFPKVHDLTVLVNLLSLKESEITQFNKDLKILNRYYIETRYPGDYPEFSWNDAQEALTVAEKVKSFVLKKEKLK